MSDLILKNGDRVRYTGTDFLQLQRGGLYFVFGCYPPLGDTPDKVSLCVDDPSDRYGGVLCVDPNDVERVVP